MRACVPYAQIIEKKNEKIFDVGENAYLTSNPNADLFFFQSDSREFGTHSHARANSAHTLANSAHALTPV